MMEVTMVSGSEGGNDGSGEASGGSGGVFLYELLRVFFFYLSLR